MSGLMMRLACVAFGAIALAPAAAAQRATPDGPTMVFFDWAKPEITRDAATILDKVAETYRSNTSMRLNLAGHSDRSGPAAANLQSSRVRAQAVRDYLQKQGVASSAMSISAFGETRPLVPTEDGVREVQNRRVEITAE